MVLQTQHHIHGAFNRGMYASAVPRINVEVSNIECSLKTDALVC